MHNINKLLVINIFSLLSTQASAHICFTSTQYADQTICYTTDIKHDLIAKNSFIKFTQSINNPGNIVSLQGEMKKRYSPEQLHDALIQYYSHLTPDSIVQIIS